MESTDQHKGGPPPEVPVSVPGGKKPAPRCGADRGSVTPFDDQRRSNPRFKCHVATRARLIEAGKEYRVAIGEWFGVEIEDISRGGVGLITPWPLAHDDLLEIEIPIKGQVTVCRGQVVRVRQPRDGRWLAGIAFVSGGTAEKAAA